VRITDLPANGGIGYTTSPIAGTTDPALYQTVHWGDITYTTVVPNGSYTVTLKFAESFVATAGTRVKDIYSNGQRVLAGFDIFAAAGGMNIAVDRQFTLNVTSGQIAIQFVNVKYGNIVSAIAIAPGS
jgi:hypothetical protein